jgi:hypothetical protein
MKTIVPEQPSGNPMVGYVAAGMIVAIMLAVVAGHAIQANREKRELRLAERQIARCEGGPSQSATAASIAASYECWTSVKALAGYQRLSQDWRKYVDLSIEATRPLPTSPPPRRNVIGSRGLGFGGYGSGGYGSGGYGSGGFGNYDPPGTPGYYDHSWPSDPGPGSSSRPIQPHQSWPGDPNDRDGDGVACEYGCKN